MKLNHPLNLIGLMVDQNPNVLTGLLAILKSGSGFVPLDPKHPAERINFVLKDCSISILLTERKWKAKALKLARDNPLLKSVICIDELPHGEAGGPDGAPEADPGARHPAPRAAASDPEQCLYVIYTSGSTGAPKGVPITHRNLVPMLLWGREYFQLGEHTKVLQNLSHCFDFGIFEILTTAVFGGTLYFLDKLEAGGANFYPRFVEEHGINTIHSTPSFFTDVIARECVFDSLATVHLGGEQLTRAAVERVFESVGDGCVLYNGYGPTEASVNSTIHAVGDKSAALALSRAPAASVPIGRPSASNRVYVLDRHQRQVPIGSYGELCVGGPGLSQGYLNRPALTAEKFIPDPFGAQPGARLYRTGDIVRFNASGELEFIGRADQQVKVRGFRIELGEVEAALHGLAEIKDAVVVARETHRGEKRLVAYLVPQTQDAPTVAQLRKQLQQRLPEYMVPSAFVTLAALPLTPNGKVDRRALPEPGGAGEEGEGYVAPRTAAEELMALVWAEVLGVERVGVEDDFFELGGHSLLATQVVARIRKHFGADLPLRALFETPTVASLAPQAVRAGGNVDASPIQPIPRDGGLPLSFAQQRLWILDQLEAGDSSYYVPLAVRIRGALDGAALDRSLKEIVRRHESLRTRFLSDGGRPQQVIDAESAFALKLVDLSALSEDARAAEMERITREEAQEPFDLSAGPVLRSTLVRQAEADHVLFLTMHHIVSDGWSLGVLAREVSQLYGAFVNGRESPLPDLPIQYVDYSAWQRRWLSGEVFDRQWSYWKRQLEGAPPALLLPTDRPRPAVQGHRGALASFTLDAGLVEGLKALCRREGATLYMVLLAAYLVLLHRYTGQEDISVGTPIAGRTRAETEGLIGLFVNTLVIRTDLSGRPSFAELLRRVRAVTLEAYANQDMPIERLVKELSSERDLSRSPLFQTMFILQNAPAGNLELGEAQLEPLTVDTGASKFELSMSLQEREGLLAGSLEYNTDLFDRVTIERLVGHYRTLLVGIVARSDEEIGLLPLLTEEERWRLLLEWGRGPLPPGEQTCIHTLFEAQADSTPDAPALVCGAVELTYAELDARANRLAHHLIKLGAAPGVLVGICLSRSTNLVAALLGVLKTGAAYLPLDPAYPAERLEYMLADSQAPLVLLDGASARHQPPANERALYLDEMEEELRSGESAARPRIRTGADELAYVIYTSGSTGGPKGVAIEHRSAAVLLRWSRELFSADELGGVLASTSVCFDISIFEIFAPLAAGGTVIMARDALELPDLSGKERVTLVNTVPSAATELLRMEALPESVRTVNLAGEALPQRLAQQVLGLPQVERLYNLYGPTEDTTYSTCSSVQPGAATPPTIGRPILGTRAYVFDRNLQPVPQGVIGELYLAGAGLARGYLRRPLLTAERFLPDPCADRPGDRMYRSGDLVRWLPNGELEFLGRRDNQVKVRGFRIELGEIEAALEEHPSVAQAAVVVKEDASGYKRLTAYVVPRQQLSAGELREELQRQLPEYMVPSAFVTLAALPLTPNGKVDRRALPEPGGAGEEGEGYVAPRTAAEELMALVWAEVLGVERVGVEDDFFELGGDSLLCIRATALSRQAGLHFTSTELFQARTVAALARICDRRAEAGSVAVQPSAADLRKEAVLDEEIAPEAPWSRESFEPKQLLLTGGTGFLGPFLLHALLKQTQAEVFCLVRCDSTESGALKIRRALEASGLWHESFASRIIPVPGDLSRPRLGLAPGQFDSLAAGMDAIYHNGAVVNLAHPYAWLKAANVLGTRDLLCLACRAPTKPFHYISTTSVFSSTDKAGPIFEADEPEPPATASGNPIGYAQSKWVAERLTASALGRGVPANIYRPGTITGDSRTGIFNGADLFSRFIKGCIQLGSFPDWEGEINIIPVDYVGEAIVRLSLQKNLLGQNFHLMNPASISWASFVDWLRSFGYSVERLPYPRWRQAVEQGPRNALYPLLANLPDAGHEPDEAGRKSATRRPAEFDCANTLAGLAGSQVACPAPDRSLIHTYLRRMVETGFLQTP